MKYICKACGKEFELTENQERKYKRYKKKGIIKDYCCSQRCRSSLLPLETKKVMYEKSSKSIKKYWDEHPERKQEISNIWSNKTEKEKEVMKKKVHDYWENISEEEKVAFGKKISDSWKNKSQEEKMIIINKKKEIVTDIWKNRTNKERQDISNKFRETWKNKSQEELKEFSKKVSIGHLKFWENITQEERKEVFRRIHKIAKQRGSYKTSKAEEQFYNLALLKNKNVDRQYYKDGFVFDFKLDNILIEFNGKYFHNYKPFKNTKEDVEEYNKMVSQGGRYKSIAYKWRFTDVGKLTYCKENNINFVAIYYSNNAKFDKFIDDICNGKYSNGQYIIDYEKTYKFKKY